MADANTKLLLHLNGVDGVQETTDASDSSHAITFHGTAQLDTAQKKFSLSSVLLDGDSDWLSAIDHADWNFGSGEFTLEVQVRCATRPALGRSYDLISQWDGGNNKCGFIWFIQNRGFDNYAFGFYYATDGQQSSAAGGDSDMFTFLEDKWYHLAVVRDGNTLRFFVDGVQKGTVNLTGITFYNVDAELNIGAEIDGAEYLFKGWIDEVRISNVARWTEGFTPPTIEYGVPVADVAVFMGANF